ncbi:hypothetical protein EAG_07166 [Camponotus floridanus]|uniref:Uncharacterized protein n=1 Tax=Camponotus floridanus TaxID=104421 RepID=E2ADF0_CAMFO|nr:hypothetical protein EAG_07166 [Camponotus floridanus]
MGPDSIKHKFSLQDNGSAKYFQGAMHTPNMGEKVAQIMTEHRVVPTSGTHADLAASDRDRSPSFANDGA